MLNKAGDGMQKKQERGMSLIEVILGMAITVIVMTVCVSWLGVSVKSLQFNMVQQRNEMESRHVLNQIVDELRYAGTVSQPAFVLNQSPPNQAAAISYTVDGEARTIALGTGADAHTLIVTRGSTQTKLAANIVQSILFKRDSTLENKIVIQLTLQDAGDSQPNGMNVSTIVMVNNLKPSQL